MLISKLQSEANRRNAQLSTGPKSAEGKAAVRLNALRHGLRARSLLLPGENAEDFQQLCADLESEWNPRTRTEQLLVEQMAVSQWKLARLETGERSIFIQDMPAERQLALLDRFSAQRSRLERAFSKAIHELQQLRKTNRITRAVESSAGRRALTVGRVAEDVGADGAAPSAQRYVMTPAPLAT